MCLSAASRRLPTAASASIALSLLCAAPLRCRAFCSPEPCNRMGDWSVYAHTFHCTHARLRGRLEQGDRRRHLLARYLGPQACKCSQARSVREYRRARRCVLAASRAPELLSRRRRGRHRRAVVRRRGRRYPSSVADGPWLHLQPAGPWRSRLARSRGHQEGAARRRRHRRSARALPGRYACRAGRGRRRVLGLWHRVQGRGHR